jgi:hypothetical protein
MWAHDRSFYQNPRPLPPPPPPRPLPLPPLPRSPGPPLPLPRPRTSSFFRPLGFGASSTSRVSNGNASGSMKYRMLFPRMDKESRVVGSRFLVVIFTVLRWVFICMSTPIWIELDWIGEERSELDSGDEQEKATHL